MYVFSPSLESRFLEAQGRRQERLSKYLSNKHKCAKITMSWAATAPSTWSPSINHYRALCVRVVGSTLASWGVRVGSSALPAMGTVLILDQSL